MPRSYAHKSRKKEARRMSELDYALHLAKRGLTDTQASQTVLLSPKKKKAGGRYGIERVMHTDGEMFDSPSELRKWLALVEREKAGEITDLKRQVQFVLAPAVDLGEKRRKKAMVYTADYAYTVVVPVHSYETEGGYVVADAKGKMTSKLPDWRMRKHLMASVHSIIVREL